MNRSFWFSLAISFCCCWGAAFKVIGQAFQEKQVQAVFVFNFTQFVEWPNEMFPTATNAFVIGVLGPDPIRDHIERVVENETVQNRPVRVRHYRRAQDVADCHILFVSRSEVANIEEMLPAFRRKNVLTVSDAEGFAHRGGIIQFRTERNRVRLTVNLEAARAARLNISSKLLRFVNVIPRINPPP